MDNAPWLSIVVCTYDRVALTTHCVSTLELPHGDHLLPDYEIIIVNNHPESQSALESSINDLSLSAKVNILVEPVAGLSRARNKGWRHASGLYVAFIDDDAYVEEDFLPHAFDIMRKGGYDCFGGHIQAWWKTDRPRWLSADYGSKPVLADTRQIISTGYNWGSNIFIKKSWLSRVNGFEEEIGMRGKKLGYSAENEIQKKIRNHGGQIAYDPELVVHHLVAPYKLKLSWQIYAQYVTARDGKDIYPEQYTARGIWQTAKRLAIIPFKSTYWLFFCKYYYWENACLDIATPAAQLLGKIRSHIRHT